MTNGVGGNPNEGLQDGQNAEALASAMAGLADMFDLVVEDAVSVAGEDDVEAAYRAFKERHFQDFLDVQEHGLQLADNIQAGASEIALNDLENAEEFAGTTSDTPAYPNRPVNFH